MVGQRRVAECHAHVAQHGGVGQVALPTADGQLLAQVAQQGVGQAQIAFGVFKIDGVDLVRHGARAHLAVLEPLFEIAQRHIAPDITRPVNQDGIGPRDCIKQFGHVVVRFDLDAVGLKVQPQAQWLGRFHHFATEFLPVKVGPGRQVRVVVTHRTVHLGQNFHGGNAVAGRVQAHHHVGNLLAHGGRAGSLAVGAAEHGDVGMGVGHLPQLHQHPVQRRQHHHIAGTANLKGMAGVIDVFAGTGKVHKLVGGLQFGARFKLRLDPVFHRLYIVVGGFLNRLDRLAIGFGEILHQPQQVGAGPRRQGLELGKSGVAQGDEPGHFDLHAPLHIALLAHQRAQCGKFGGVAAVQRGEC